MDAPLEYYERLLSDEAEAIVAARIAHLKKLTDYYLRDRALTDTVMLDLRQRFPNA